MTLSNYEITRNKMRSKFISYDLDRITRKFHLDSDEKFLYVDFVDRTYRIGKETGIVEWSGDGFKTTTEGDFNESMTIYDVLCCSSDDCHLSGSYCPLSMLKGTVESDPPGGNLYQKSADYFSGKRNQLEQACQAHGETVSFQGDYAAKFYPFSFLPVILQFWDADDEFPASLKFMFDESILQFMHYETVYYMMGHLLSRLRAWITDTEQ